MPIAEPSAGQLAQLVYNGIAICDRDGKLNLTDMWKAGGADPARRPSNWLASADAPRLTVFLAEVVTAGDSGSLTEAVEGRFGGSWAHWQLSLAYASYLSPPFHARGNQVIRDRIEGKIGRPEALAAWSGEAGPVAQPVAEVSHPAPSAEAVEDRSPDLGSETSIAVPRL